MDIKPISVGFTGTKYGMTFFQQETCSNIIFSLDMYEFHHGMCIGADYEAHWMACQAGIRLVGHPPEDQSKMDEFDNLDFIHTPKPYLRRNQDIVHYSDLVIACPKSEQEELRSGTWATIRYCEKTNVRCIIIFPKGNIHIL